MKKPKIFTIGGATFDIFVQADDQSIFSIQTSQFQKKWLAFPHGGKVKVRQVLEAFGGGATNTAVTFARQGLEVAFVGKIGKEYGEKIVANLKNEGVDTRYVKTTGRDKTGFSTIINTFDGDRTVLAYPGANRFFNAADLPMEDLAKADWIFLNHLAEDKGDIPAALVHLLKAHPTIKLAWNPGHEQIMQGAKNWANLLKHVEILFVNKEEAAAFSKLPSRPAAFKANDPKAYQWNHLNFLPPYADDVSEIFSYFRSLRVKNTVITDGRNGAQASDGTYLYFCPIVSHERVDTLGAGDAFASGFTVAMIKGLPLKTAMLYGTLNAGNVVIHPGAQGGILTAGEMEQERDKNQTKVKSTKF